MKDLEEDRQKRIKRNREALAQFEVRVWALLLRVGAPEGQHLQTPTHAIILTQQVEQAAQELAQNVAQEAEAQQAARRAALGAVGVRRSSTREASRTAAQKLREAASGVCDLTVKLCA